jgi:hypothetical protein
VFVGFGVRASQNKAVSAAAAAATAQDTHAHLAVGVHAAVGHQLLRVLLAAVAARDRLVDDAVDDARVRLGVAAGAAEGGDAHVGDDAARARHHAAHADERVDVRGVEVADRLAVLGAQVEEAHL